MRVCIDPAWFLRLFTYTPAVCPVYLADFFRTNGAANTRHFSAVANGDLGESMVVAPPPPLFDSHWHIPMLAFVVIVNLLEFANLPHGAGHWMQRIFPAVHGRQHTRNKTKPPRLPLQHNHFFIRKFHDNPNMFLHPYRINQLYFDTFEWSELPLTDFKQTFFGQFTDFSTNDHVHFNRTYI